MDADIDSFVQLVHTALEEEVWENNPVDGIHVEDKQEQDLVGGLDFGDPQLGDSLPEVVDVE